MSAANTNITKKLIGTSISGTIPNGAIALSPNQLKNISAMENFPLADALCLNA